MSAAQTVEAIVPELRFSAFKEHWRKSELADIASIQRGRFSPRPRNNPIYYGGEIPFVQTSDVVNSGGRIRSFTQTLNEKGLKVSKLFPEGTILITIAANIGYTGVLQIDMACPDSLVGIICNPETHNYFLDYLLQKEQPKMDYLAVEAAQKNINIGFLEIYVLTLPALPEQRKIADFLTAVDGRIGHLIQKKALLEDYKKGVMQQLFTQAIRFKDDHGNDFPDWEEKTLADVVEHFSSGATPYRGKPEYYTGDIKWISSGELNYNTIYDTIEHITEQARTDTNLRMHPPGTFLMAITGLEAAGTRGSCAITGVAATTNQSCMAIYPNKLLNNDFLYQWYKHNGERLAFRYCQGTKQQSYTAGILKIVPISLPRDLGEQTKIADFLSAIDRKIESVATQITETQTFKRGLLQQMFV